MGTTSERIYILGVGNVGKFIAHGIRKSFPQAPITLLFHRPDLATEWNASSRKIRCTPCISAPLPQSVKENIIPSLYDAYGFETEILRRPSPQYDSSFVADAPISNLVVTTKTYATTDALSLVKHRLGAFSHILLIQNGMGVIEEIDSRLLFATSSPKHEARRPIFWAGIANFGVHREKRDMATPFEIVHAGRGALLLGRANFPLSSAPLEQPNCRKKKKQGESEPIPTMIKLILKVPELEGMIYPSAEGITIAQLRKLVVNAVINPLTTILKCENGKILCNTPKTEQSLQRSKLVQRLVEEIGPIVRSQLPKTTVTKDKFSNKDLLDAVYGVAEMTRKNTSSMLQDTLAGRKTEIDYINGYIIAKGKDISLNCPINQELVKLVKGELAVVDPVTYLLQIP